MQLDVLTDAIDGLIAAGLSALSDPEAVKALHVQFARLDAVLTTSTAALEASRRWEESGAKSVTAWVTKECVLPKRVARARVSLGRKLRHLPECEQAWSAGEITADHVATIGAVRRKETAEALARDEKLLVDIARQMTFEMFSKMVAYWQQDTDPDGAEDDEKGRAVRRDVYLDESFQGMWLGRMQFGPIDGTIVATEMNRLERELFEQDWAEAKARLGHEPNLADLARTPGQRRADAIVEMAVRSRIAPAGGQRPAPLFSVLVGYETMHGRICELAGGTVIAPGALIPWLDQAYMERAVFGLANRVECSVTARLFTGATRRAIEVRDRQCQHDYCDVPADQCEVDHIIPYPEGPTNQANGEMLCGFHNRRKGRKRGDPPHHGHDPDDGE